jgi:phosphatidylinositol alpha-1,6-mannosyltransferase
MILVLTQNFPPDVGGIEIYVGQLVKALVAKGERVSVFADATPGAQASDARLDGVTVRRFSGPRPLRRLLKAWAAHRLLATTPCKGIFCDSWKSLALLPRPRVPVVVLAHGNEYLGNGWRRRSRVSAALRKAGVVVANSRYTAGLVQPFAHDRLAVKVIHPPIEPLPEAEPRAMARLADRIGGGRPLLAGVGRLEPRKGFDKVIAALPDLVQRFPGLTLAIGGDGPDRARLEALAQDKGIGGRVVFLGRVDDAMRTALLSSADLFVMPARRAGRSVEGYGIVYAEAAWYGIPSVAGAIGGGAEAVIDGETGYVVPGDDEAAVGAAVERLLSDDALRRRMGEEAQRRVRQQGTWAESIDAYLDTLHAAAAPSKAAADRA